MGQGFKHSQDSVTNLDEAANAFEALGGWTAVGFIPVHDEAASMTGFHLGIVFPITGEHTLAVVPSTAIEVVVGDVVPDGINNLACAGRDDERVYATAANGLFVSRDQGRSFEQLQKK